jgi:hypothetical protein
MSTTKADPRATVQAQAEEIVTSGKDIRPRLAKVVAEAACASEQAPEGLVALVRAVTDGAAAGLARAVPKDRDDVLRQVVDALGDGLSRTALAGQLAIEEAVSSSRHYSQQDLASLRDDLAALRELFAETVARGLKTCTALTKDQVTRAVTHTERVAENFGPAIARVLDVVRQHPLELARAGVKAGVSAGEGAAASLREGLGRMLEKAGAELRRREER